MNPDTTNDGNNEQHPLGEPDDDDLPVDPALAQEAARAHERLFAKLRSDAEVTESDTEDIDTIRKFEEALPPEQMTPGEKQIQDALDAAHADDMRECARDFQHLLDSLPPELSSLAHFDVLQPASSRVCDSFMVEEDVRAAGALGQKLARIGMRPSDFIESIHVIAMLCERMRDPRCKAPYLQQDGSLHIPRTVLLADVRCDHMNPDSFEPFIDWIQDVLRCKPELLMGFHVTVTTDGIIAKPLSESIYNVPSED